MSLRIRASLPILLALLPGVLAAQGTERPPNRPDPRVSEALKLWTGGQTSTRQRALQRLARLGPRASSAVPALIPGLTDPDPAIRKKSAEVLRRIGPAANKAVPALILALNDPASDVRAAAARALMTTKPEPKQVIPALIASLHAGPDRSCPTAVDVLGTLGESAVPALIDLLRDCDPTLRRMAAACLMTLGPTAKSSLPGLIEALRVPERETRDQIASALAAIGPEAVEPLIVALRDRDPKVRGGAALALERLGQRAKAAVPALVAALSDLVEPDDPTPPRGPSLGIGIREGEPRPSGYYAALRAIGLAAVPVLLDRLDRGADRRAKVLALRALGFLQDKAKAAVSRLIALLSDPDLRFEAASALGGIGARAAIPPLRDGLGDPDPAFRARAAEVIGRIGWEQPATEFGVRETARGAVAPLTAALKDPDPLVRAAAARALGDIGTGSSSAIPDLAARLRDPSADVRLAALRAFPRIGMVPESARQTVIVLLKHCDPRVRLAAAKLIGVNDLTVDAIVAGLLAALQDPSAEVRAEAAYRLALTNGRQGLIRAPNNVEHVNGFDSAALLRSENGAAILRAALADPDPRVRTLAAHVLPLFKREATATVPLLAARLKDPDDNVRVAAAMALGQYAADAASAIPALIDAIADRGGIGINDFCVAAKSAQALQAIGPDAEALMLDRLFILLANAHKDVRGSARIALQWLGANVGPRVAQAFTDPQTPRIVKIGLLHALAARIDWFASENQPERLKLELPRVILNLRALAADDDLSVRADVRKLLAAVEPGDESAARMLLDAARDDDPNDPTFDFDGAELALEPSAAAVLIAGLKDPDEEVRTVAAHALAALGDKLPVPEETPGSDKPTPAEIEARAIMLQPRTEISEALIPMLRDQDTGVRWAAAWGLYVFGGSEKAVHALTEMLADRTTRVRHGARIRFAQTLGGGHVDRSERSANGESMSLGAIQALGGFGALAAPAVPALIVALRDDDALTRWFAAAVLAEIGPNAKAAVPELVGQLWSKDEVPSSAPGPSGFGQPSIRPDRLAVIAARALGKIGPDARAAVPALTRTLADPDEAARAEVAEALGNIGGDASAAVPSLVRALADPESSVGDKAAEALGRIGAAAVPALIEALHRGDSDARRRAVVSLGGVGPNAAKALPDLIQALADPDEEIRVGVAMALGLIGDGPDAAIAVTGLIAAVADTDQLVRNKAIESLGKIGSKDERGIPTLIGTMRDRASEVKSAATDALITIGMPAFPALRGLLRDDDGDVRDNAARALALIAHPTYSRSEGETDEQASARVKVARDALFTCLEDPDERIRAGAVRALGNLANDVVTELVLALGDPSARVRVEASKALGVIGDAANAALGALRERLGDPDPEVRGAAEATINGIAKSEP